MSSSSISQDADNIEWNQLPNEPDAWFDRFYRYGRPLGVEFTAKRAYLMYTRANKEVLNAETNALPLWSDIAYRWQWQARAKAWAAEERFIITQQWHQRRLELLEEDWSTGGDLRRLAVKFLATIDTVRETGQDGDGNIVFELNITPGQLAQLMKTASELQRLGVGEPTEIHGRAEAGVGIYLPAADKPE